MLEANVFLHVHISYNLRENKLYEQTPLNKDIAVGDSPKWPCYLCAR